MADPLLELSTLTNEDRPTVKIDGVAYPIKRRDELPALSADWITRTGVWFESLRERTDITPEEEVEADDKLRRLVKTVVVAPPSVLERLAPMQVLQVCVTFSQLLTDSAPAAGVGADHPTSRSTGAKSFRRSSGSTAATRGGGSRRSRLAS